MPNETSVSWIRVITSIETYLQGVQHMKYERMVTEVLQAPIPNAYTTMKTVKQKEENLLRVLHTGAWEEF